jgi:hypothetical protein
VKEIDKEKEREKRLLARKRLRRLRARAKQRRLEEEKARAEQIQPGPASPGWQQGATRLSPEAAGERERNRLREITVLEREVAELSRLTGSADVATADMERIRREVAELKHEFYAHLGAWQRLIPCVPIPRISSGCFLKISRRFTVTAALRTIPH